MIRNTFSHSFPSIPFIPKLLAAALAVGAFLAGSAPASAQPTTCHLAAPDPFRHLEKPEGLEMDDPIDTTEACPTWRFLAVLRRADRDCPKPPAGECSECKADKLFKTTHPAGLPPVLRPYCVYKTESADTEPLQEWLEKKIRRGLFREVVSGCAAVAPAADADPLAAQDWRAVSDHFLVRAGALDLNRSSISTAGRADPPVFNSDPPVRLAVLDTQPEALWSHRGNSRHGYTLAHMIERLICAPVAEGSDPRSACAARVKLRLALPIAEFSASDPGDYSLDPEMGGYYGTIDQLATAVWDELEGWLQQPEPVDPLVINLAVGWVGERFGGLEDRVWRMPAPVRTLYHALELASCSGALVVAAAGNRVGGPLEEPGALLPGAWEDRDAPSPKRCAKLLTEPWRRGDALDRAPARDTPGELLQPSFAAREPLVYAAAGVRSDGSPLVNARPSSTPRRVAYGNHALITVGDEPSARLTGSSVATSVIAAAAAVIWAQNPRLARAEVMRILESSGQPLTGRRPDLGKGAASDVRLVRVCDALDQACEEGHCDKSAESYCMASRAVSVEPDGTGKDKGLVCNPYLGPLNTNQCELLSFSMADPVDKASSDIPEFCGLEKIHFSDQTDSTSHPCPFRQFFALLDRPWSGPQPQSDPCVTCEIRPPPPVLLELPPDSNETNGYSLKMDIDPEWPENSKIKNAVLRIDDATYDLQSGQLYPGECYVVQGIDPALFGPGAHCRPPRAAVQFLIEYMDEKTNELLKGSDEVPVLIGAPD